MRSLVLSLLALVVASCGGDDGGTPPGDNFNDSPPLWSDYVLGFGETINLREDVAIEFVDVEEDSRCPNNLVCVQEGNARVLVKAITPRGATLIRLNTQLGLPTSALFDYYGIALRRLEPYPAFNAQTGSAEIPDSEYEATVFVYKAAEPQ
jgi:hypothetical protein